jgi:N-acetylneuraminic acid mutarotase
VLAVVVALVVLSGGAGVAQAAPGWSQTGSMAAARVAHTATLLQNGRVLVAGGNATRFGSPSALAGAELYNPATGSWSPAAAMSRARVAHTATRLQDGRVLVVGGRNGSGALAGAELYNPATNSWSSAASMSTARFGHTATLLSNGKVLVVGGSDGVEHPLDPNFPDEITTTYLSSAEVYDPATNSWSDAGEAGDVRFAHSATRLSNGRVLVAGGASRLHGRRAGERRALQPGDEQLVARGGHGNGPPFSCGGAAVERQGPRRRGLGHEVPLAGERRGLRPGGQPLVECERDGVRTG